MMRSKCEVAVHDVFPVARSLLAKKLIDAYGLSQTQASKKMGISQPAISQYKKDIRGGMRGSLSENPGFMKLVDEIAKRLAEGSVKAEQMPKEMCRFCRLLFPQ